jgi:acetyltransferase-like isoleucine patch superfamily enzyme
MINFNKFQDLILQIVESLLRNISGKIGILLRAWFYSKRFAECGKNLRIDEGVIIQGVKNIYLGDNVWLDKYSILMAGKLKIHKRKIKYNTNINYTFEEGELHLGSNIHIGINCIIQAHGGVNISDNFTMSAGAKIYSLSNDVGKCKNGTFLHNETYYIMSPICIKNNVWIGLNSVVLGGTIEANCFITPNSIVTKSLENNIVAHGKPAKKVKHRFNKFERLS